MRNWILIISFILSLATAFGQTPIGGTANQQGGGDRLNLVSSNSGRINAKTGHMVFYIPVYEHKGNTLSADSGYIYEDEVKRQFFEAFGNVVITQPSGTVIYSDYLHYDAAAQHALLTGNVKMIDKGSTLTTNHLTYNMRSKVGTYTGGGRIVSQGDTITSKNAYYFENTSDAYFRHKVVVRTPNVKVYTDTMRYNSLSKMTYFFGPTNIKGNKNENLYTERGTYNTGSGIANFNKNNLYTEGSKFLKGDSLHYERSNGIGEAFRNVVFVDTTDKFYAYGGRGLYKQDEESILMTDKPYIITVVKDDSTSNSSTTTDSTSTDIKLEKAEKTKKEIKKDQKENKTAAKENTEKADEIKGIKPSAVPDNSPRESKVDSVYMTADTLFSKMILVKDYKPLQLNLSRDGGKMEADDEPNYGDDEDGTTNDSTAVSLPKVSQDSTLKQIKNIDQKEEIKKAAPAVKKELANKATVTKAKTNVAEPNRMGNRQEIGSTLKADSVLRQKAIVPIANHADTIINKALKVAQTPDSIKKTSVAADSLLTSPSDTARTRIVRAHYNVRLFKSDLQAVADSVYYGMVDSMFRFMGRPMIWSQGSQISADTIFMQIIDQKMDNALLKENAFMVNAVLDSVKFNQLKGRKITAFFANNNIEKLFVDGNAENLVFMENNGIITEMFHDRGGRIKVKLENKKIIDYTSIHKVDQKVYPFKLVTQENEILPGFIWRPQDRPTSKEDLLNRKREAPTPVESKDEEGSEKGKAKETTKEELENITEKEETKKEEAQ